MTTPYAEGAEGAEGAEDPEGAEGNVKEGLP
jgi:hypothetical protein